MRVISVAAAINFFIVYTFKIDFKPFIDNELIIYTLIQKIFENL